MLLQFILLLYLIILIKQCKHDNLDITLVLNGRLNISYCVISWPFSRSLLNGVSLIICIFFNLSLPQTIKLVKCLFFVHYTRHWYMGLVERSKSVWSSNLFSYLTFIQVDIVKVDELYCMKYLDKLLDPRNTSFYLDFMTIFLHFLHL